MKPLDLSLKYMDIFYSGNNIDDLSNIFSKDFSFEGPLYRFDSAKSYIDALKKDPPTGMTYEIIQTFENESTVCLIYQFLKQDISTPMAQVFEIEKEKIKKILLIFDTRVFKESLNNEI